MHLVGSAVQCEKQDRQALRTHLLVLAELLHTFRAIRIDQLGEGLAYKFLKSAAICVDAAAVATTLRDFLDTGLAPNWNTYGDDFRRLNTELVAVVGEFASED